MIMTILFQLKIRHFLFNFEQEVSYFFIPPKRLIARPQKSVHRNENHRHRRKKPVVKRCLVQELGNYFIVFFSSLAHFPSHFFYRVVYFDRNFFPRENARFAD